MLKIRDVDQKDRDVVVTYAVLTKERLSYFVNAVNKNLIILERWNFNSRVNWAWQNQRIFEINKWFSHLLYYKNDRCC